MLLQGQGKLRCEVKVKDVRKVTSVSWMDENMKTLMNTTDVNTEKTSQDYALPLDITFDEWNKGIRRICFMEHKDLLTGLQKEYVRENGEFTDAQTA